MHPQKIFYGVSFFMVLTVDDEKHFSEESSFSNNFLAARGVLS